MTLFDEVSSLMFEALTLYRFEDTDQRGEDTFEGSTEYISPVRLTRVEGVGYDDRGREVRTRGKIIMPVPSGGIVNKRDKLVMDEGEIYRVFSVRETRDMSGDAYLVLVVT